MGILDAFNNMTPEQNQGLLAAISQIAQASGPSRGGHNTAAALAGGMQAYQQTLAQARMRKLAEQRQAQQDQFQQEYRTVQMDGLKSQKAEREAKMLLETQRQEAVRKAIKPDGTLDMQALVTSLAPFDPDGAADIAKGLMPKPATYGQPQEVVIKGKPALAVFDNQGNPKVLEGFSPYQAPKQSGSGGGAARGSIEAAAGKPLPTQALKMLNTEQEALATAGNIRQRLSDITAQIDGGTLDFGPLRNVKNQALNMIGSSTEESRNFASFKSTLEKLRNDSLRLNAGVQTDGDAQRAWNELFANITDKQYVKQRLKEIDGYNQEAQRIRQSSIDTINGNYGRKSGGSTGNPFQGAAIPQAAAAHLKMNPKLRDAFDAKYGAGAAASVLGK